MIALAMLTMFDDDDLLWDLPRCRRPEQAGGASKVSKTGTGGRCLGEDRPGRALSPYLVADRLCAGSIGVIALAMLTMFDDDDLLWDLARALAGPCLKHEEEDGDAEAVLPNAATTLDGTSEP